VALSRGFRRVGPPTTLPCGVRTFLEGPVFSPTSPRLLGRQPINSRASEPLRRPPRSADSQTVSPLTAIYAVNGYTVSPFAMTLMVNGDTMPRTMSDFPPIYGVKSDTV
jgi:hypothetical protein